MEYVRLGSTGLEVSRLVLGCMSFGDPERGPHPWTLDEESSRPLIRQALEAGIRVVELPTAGVLRLVGGGECWSGAHRGVGVDQLPLAA